MNDDLISFTKSILERYNATPDEWDHFEDVKWSMDITHKITTPEVGERIAKIVMPCVEQEAMVKKKR